MSLRPAEKPSDVLGLTVQAALTALFLLHRELRVHGQQAQATVRLPLLLDVATGDRVDKQTVQQAVREPRQSLVQCPHHAHILSADRRALVKSELHTLVPVMVRVTVKIPRLW